MAFFKSNSKTLTKLRTYKKDLAPVGFYFDIFSMINYLTENLRYLLPPI
jgi:hypothetical protein